MTGECSQEVSQGEFIKDSTGAWETKLFCTLEELRACFEDTLNQKLQSLERKLISELVGIRSDLRQNQQSMMLLADDPAEQKSQWEESAWLISNHSHQKEAIPSDAHQTDNSDAKLTENVVNSNEIADPSSPRSQPSLKRSNTVDTKGGVRAMMADSQSSIITDIVDKFMIRNELAQMRRSTSVTHWWTNHLGRLASVAHWWKNLEEPTRSGCLAGLVKARGFEVICILVIAANSTFIAFNADWEIRHIHQRTPSIFVIAEVVCSSYFILELALRLLVHRFYFFVNDEMRMNCFDFCIVLLGCFDLVIIFAEQTSESATNDNFVLARVCRLLKLAKMFRTMRALRFFKDLVVIMEGIRHSLTALFWIFVMLGLLLFMFALVFLQGVVDYMISQEGQLQRDEQILIFRHFGSMWGSILSLYCAVTGGSDWFTYYEIIVKLGPVYAAMFVGFTFFFLFAMFNILTGLFVEKAAVASKPDIEEIIMSQKKKANVHAAELKSICVLLDEHGSGQISWEQFERMMANPIVVAYMSSIGLEVHEPELFFSMVCDSLTAHAVSIDLFVDRCMELKGLASSIDSRRNLLELHCVRSELEILTNAIRNLSEKQASSLRKPAQTHASRQCLYSGASPDHLMTAQGGSSLQIAGMQVNGELGTSKCSNLTL